MNNAFNQINGVSGSGRCIIRNNILMVFIIAAFFTFLLSPLYVFAQVEADVATAKGIQALHEADIMALPGVIGIGIGSREEGGMEFVVLVDKDAPMPDLPSNLEGIPVVAERTSKIVIHNGGDGCDIGADQCHDDQRPLPVPMGNSTSTNQVCASGTLGFKACDNASGKIGYVTNNHVGASLFGCENGPTGLIEVHPGTGDANPVCTLSGTMPIGILSKRVTINFPGPNLVDAAFVESNNQQTSSIIRDIGTPTTTPGTPTLNKCVKKSGRTTGLTFGRINLVNFTIIGVSGYCGGAATFQDVFRVTPDNNCGLCEDPPCSSIALRGDSGSPVLDLNNNIVGLYFAGDVTTGTFGVAATIQNVLSELNVSLDLLNCGGPPGGGLCQGFCGGQAPAGCFCDEACNSFGDCCNDVCNDCPTLDFCDGGPPPPPPGGGFCDGHCGGQAPEGCFCDNACNAFGDCCNDVCNDCPTLDFCDGGPPPPPPGGGFCDGHCGGQAPEGCFCDNACNAFGDCCNDVCNDCPTLDFCDGGPPPPPPGGGFCDGHCGGQAPEGCWCDEACDAFGDCCNDVCNDCPTLNFCP